MDSGGEILAVDETLERIRLDRDGWNQSLHREEEFAGIDRLF